MNETNRVIGPSGHRVKFDFAILRSGDFVIFDVKSPDREITKSSNPRKRVDSAEFLRIVTENARKTRFSS